jgi:hypothetical protein
MYSLGVPLSKSYMSNFFATIQEKIWRMYKTHLDFEELPIESQMKVIMEKSIYFSNKQCVLKFSAKIA